jgi:hypothetical protein
LFLEIASAATRSAYCARRFEARHARDSSAFAHVGAALCVLEKIPRDGCFAGIRAQISHGRRFAQNPCAGRCCLADTNSGAAAQRFPCPAEPLRSL